MSAKDLYHYAVRNTLEKDGWRITHDPLIIEIEDVRYLIDLGAEDLLGAQKGGRKIAIEVKSFVDHSPLHEFHSVLGQFLSYHLALELKEPERQLYVAIPVDIYEDLLSRRLIQRVARLHRLKFIVYKVQSEVIVEWIE